jgi:hypothetical protein
MSFRNRNTDLLTTLSLVACLSSSAHIVALFHASPAYATNYSYLVTNHSEIEWCNALGINASDCSSQTIQQKMHDLRQFKIMECTKLGLSPSSCTDININQRVDELAEFRAYEQTQYYYSLLISPIFIALYVGASLVGFFLWHYFRRRMKSQQRRDRKDVGRTQ